MFDKRLCMDNIYAIAKEKGIKIGNLEKAAGLSGGYLSKLSKEGNTAVPGIDSLLLIAQTLGVSIDALLSVNYKELNNDEKYLIAFIEKLIRGTESNMIAWEIEGGAYLSTNNTGGCLHHPLFIRIPSAVESPVTGEPVECDYNVYQSRFLQYDDVKGFENCYHCDLGENSDKLYMMKLSLGNKNYPLKELDFDALFSENGYEEFHEEIELYLVNRMGKVNPLCSTYSAGTEVKKVINKLYTTVDSDGRFISMSSETRSVIDRFMNLKW